MKSKVAFYLLMAFIIFTIIFIFVVPIVQIHKIEQDAKRPKNERIMK